LFPVFPSPPVFFFAVGMTIHIVPPDVSIWRFITIHIVPPDLSIWRFKIIPIVPPDVSIWRMLAHSSGGNTCPEGMAVPTTP
jgi:hypothetical protein